MFYGVLINGAIMLTNEETGFPVIDTDPPDLPDGYTATARWAQSPKNIIKVWDIEPAEGTAEQAALALSKLQFMSLPDSVAYEFRALADEWISGESYYGPNDSTGIPQSRVRYLGRLYKCLTTHVAQSDWTPVNAPSLWAEILPGQEGNEPEEGYAEWVQPTSTNGYDKGDRVLHNGHLWESNFDGANVWEPGAVGAPWTDLGVYPPEE